MITAANITDEQIRELLAARAIGRDTYEYATCKYEFVARDLIDGARSRCAAIWNGLAAASITDDETRALMSDRAAVGDDETVKTCLVALGDRGASWSGPRSVRDALITETNARARCAELINARQAGAK